MVEIHIKSKQREMAKYTTRVIHGLSILFFRTVNNIIMRKFAILYYYLLKMYSSNFKKKLDEVFFPSYGLTGEVVLQTTTACNSL